MYPASCFFPVIYREIQGDTGKAASLQAAIDIAYDDLSNGDDLAGGPAASVGWAKARSAVPTSDMARVTTDNLTQHESDYRRAHLVGRVIVGTLVYICIVVLAAPFPSAAGLMLTFPALNGLGFFFAKWSSVGAMARSMLWLPIINGSLCVGFMIVFLMLMRAVDQRVLALGLFAAVVGLWTLIAFRPEVRRGIPEHRQLPYVIICTLVGLLFVGIAHFLLPGVGAAAADVGIFSWQSIARVVLGNKAKIVLFAAALTIFLAAVTRVPDEIRGILAGLPLVPFGGLLSVAGFSDLDVEKQQRVFENMLTSVALGPAVAVWFIYGFSRYLKSRRILSSERLDRLMRFMSLIAAWMLCAIAVAAVSCALIAAS